MSLHLHACELAVTSGGGRGTDNGCCTCHMGHVCVRGLKRYILLAAAGHLPVHPRYLRLYLSQCRLISVFGRRGRGAEVRHEGSSSGGRC